MAEDVVSQILDERKTLQDIYHGRISIGPDYERRPPRRVSGIVAVEDVGYSDFFPVHHVSATDIEETAIKLGVSPAGAFKYILDRLIEKNKS